MIHDEALEIIVKEVLGVLNPSGSSTVALLALPLV